MNVESVDAALVRRILAISKPEFVFEEVSFLGEGWDNRLFLVNQGLVVRMARREVDDHRLLTEASVLGAIAPLLTLPVPVPVFVLEPSSEVPRAAMGYQLIPGEPLRAEQVTSDVVAALAPALATCLEHLHAVPVAEAERLGLPIFTPTDWLRHSQDLVDRTEPDLRARLDAPTFARFESRWRDYAQSRTAIDFVPSLIHGDLAAEHVLVASDPWRVAGLIDFGDAMVADPAMDLAGLPDPLAAAVLRLMRTFGDPKSVWNRRAMYRLLSPLHAVLTGRERGDFDLLDVGIAGLQKMLES